VRKTSTVCVLICLFAGGGCASPPQRDASTGYACYRSWEYVAPPRNYKCLFELSGPSAFFNDQEVASVLEAFMRNEGGTCKALPERDVADVQTQQVDHGLRYRLYDVLCK
jgi:hypothetical protein